MWLGDVEDAGTGTDVEDEGSGRREKGETVDDDE